jgi:cytochrome P450 family 3 subfamily A
MVKKIRDSDKNEVEGLTEEMVVAQGIIFLAAGFETTSSTMSILMYNLAKYPNIQERCYEEISALLSDENVKIDQETINEMPYLEACIQETLRLYPIILRNQRYCTMDCKVNGMMIKKGTNIIVPTWAMHRNPELFGEDAKEFVPERFLEGDKMAEQISNHTFHAFGGGPRVCIGMRFAMTEMKLAMSKLLTNFAFEEEPGMTKLDLQKGGYFVLSYPEMKVRIKARNNSTIKEE